MAVTAKRLAALPLEGQAGGIHEHHAELGKQLAPAGEQRLFDEVFAAARHQSAGLRLIGERLAEPGHAEMMQLELLGAVDRQ